MSKSFNAKRIIFILVGSFCIVFSLYKAYLGFQFISHSVLTTAIIVKMPKSTMAIKLQIVFEDQNQRPVTTALLVDDPGSWVIGDKFQIRYLSSDPNVVVLPNNNKKWV